MNYLLGNFEQSGIRIPAVLRGLEYAHKLKGKLLWNEIVEPSVSLAKRGFVVSKELATEVSKNINYEILYGHISAGDILKLPDLSNILNAVALKGTNGIIFIIIIIINNLKFFYQYLLITYLFCF